MIHVVVFGLNRAPSIVIPKFEQFLKCLPSSLVIHAGFISQQSVSSSHSQEANVVLEDPNGHHWAPFVNGIHKVYSCESDLSSSYKACFTRSMAYIRRGIDLYNDNYYSVEYYIKYLAFLADYSHEIQFATNVDKILLIRPDMIYWCNPHEIACALKSQDPVSYLSGYDTCGFSNDRFLLSTADVVTSFMRRISDIPSFLSRLHRFFHPEIYAAWHLDKRCYSQRRHFSPAFQSCRVRANGLLNYDSEIYDPGPRVTILGGQFFRHKHLLQVLHRLSTMDL